MRRAALLLRRLLALCAVLAPVASCGRDGTGDEGRLPGAPPDGVTATAGSATSVHVMWNALPADPRVRAYEVYRGATKAARVPGSAHMVDVTRLRPSTTYVFTVRARDAAGRLGTHGRKVRARTPAAVATDATPPTRPGRTHGRTAGSRAVQLSWSASSDGRAVVSYDVCQGGTKIHSVGGSQRAAVVTGLRPGTRYSFTVRARDAAGNVSPPGAAVRLTTPGSDDGRDTAPTAFRAGTHRADGAYYIAI